MAGEALDVFISYSHRDEALKNELVEFHLKPLQRQGKINTWQDRNIEAGAEWAKEIKENLEKAQIILLLVTRHFIASDYCYEKEMKRAVQRHRDGKARVIPIILKPCSWKYTDFRSLQALPQNGKPVTSWDDTEEAFFNVEEGIRQVIDSLNAERLQREAAARQEQEAQLQQEREKAERRRQEQAAAEQKRQQQIEAEQQRERERTERLRRQQAAAEQKRQQQIADERLKQQAAEKRRQQQEAERLRQQRKAEQRSRGPEDFALNRRRTLQLLGYGGGGLALVSVAGWLSRDTSESNAPESNPEAADAPEPNPEAFEFQTPKVNETGEVVERINGEAQAFREDLGDGIDLEMVSIPAGEFVMGSPEDEAQRDDDEGPQRTVSVPAFWMGRFPVTQAQYRAVTGENPSRFNENGDNRPVERVTWNDAAEAFCDKLSELTGRTYRLPSEAEWEYACRAGTTTPFAFGPTITTDLANYRGEDYEYEGTTYPGNYGDGPYGEFRKETTGVGTFPANAFGLHDMHGNVWEWCQDVWHGSYEGAPTDGSAWLEGGDQEKRILRGGSWFVNPDFCRSANRNRDSPGVINHVVGFRVVWVPA